MPARDFYKHICAFQLSEKNLNKWMKYRNALDAGDDYPSYLESNSLYIRIPEIGLEQGSAIAPDQEHIHWGLGIELKGSYQNGMWTFSEFYTYLRTEHFQEVRDVLKQLSAFGVSYLELSLVWMYLKGNDDGKNVPFIKEGIALTLPPEDVIRMIKDSERVLIPLFSFQQRD